MADRTHAVTRETYDRIAARFLERTRNRLVWSDSLDAFAALCPAGGSVVDAGGGPGVDAAALRARGLRAFTLDTSLRMLRAGSLEYAGPRVQGDMRRLPVASGALCGVWANASLLHIRREEIATALAEFRRVLRPGGLLHASLKSGEGAGWESDRYGGDAPRWFTYWTASDLDDELAAAGFEPCDSRERRTNLDHWINRLARRR